MKFQLEAMKILVGKENLAFSIDPNVLASSLEKFADLIRTGDLVVQAANQTVDHKPDDFELRTVEIIYAEKR